MVPFLPLRKEAGCGGGEEKRREKEGTLLAILRQKKGEKKDVSVHKSPRGFYYISSKALSHPCLARDSSMKEVIPKPLSSGLPADMEKSLSLYYFSLIPFPFFLSQEL